MLFASVFAAACACAPATEAGGTGSPRADGSASPQVSPPTSSAAPTSTARDPLKPEVLDRSPSSIDSGEDKAFYRGADGTTFATLGYTGSHPRLWTRYRIYGPDWKARTPLLQVPSLLEILGPVSDGFIGHVLVLDAYANTRVSKLVLVRPDGTLRAVRVARQPAHLQTTDEVFPSMSGSQMAYRPSTGQAHKVRSSETKLPRYATPGYFTDSGAACSLADGDEGQVVYWTTDRGHTWKHELTRQLLRSTLEASSCDPAGSGRLVLVGANEQLHLARASTVTLSDRTLSSYRLDRRFMVDDHQIFSIVLANGTLAFHTLRHGLMVATSPANAQFEFRPAPVDYRTSVETLGPQMIHQNWGPRRDLLDISTDEGRTWQTVDLRAGSWDTAN
jgi:hypothetical protein